jgi:hypothetical protein
MAGHIEMRGGGGRGTLKSNRNIRARAERVVSHLGVIVIVREAKLCKAGRRRQERKVRRGGEVRRWGKKEKAERN